MNKLLYLLLTLIFLNDSADGRGRERSMLEVSLSDNSPLVITIDGRQYNKYGTKLTIGDLPRGWHDLTVYEYLEYKKGGGRARTVYTGRVRVKPGEFMSCVVDPRTQRISVRTMDMADRQISLAEDTEPMPDVVPGGLNVNEVNTLYDKVANLKTDINKLKLLKKELVGEQYAVGQLMMMMDWLAFESSRVDLAKWSYNRVVDKENYRDIIADFEMDTSKKELEQYINDAQ